MSNGQVSDDARKAWRHAKGAAELGQVLCALCIIGGVVTGLGFAFTRDEPENPFSSAGGEYANFWPGVAVAALSLTLGVCLYAAMAWLRWRAEQEAPTKP